MKFFISISIIISFLFSLILVPQQGYSQEAFHLPIPGSMVNLSPEYVPLLIKGLKVHPENPFLFDFILDTGKSNLKIDSPEFKIESNKLIKYFLASLTIKEDDLWVNLSPYEKDRMIPKELGQTELGRDMLAEDYILKQLSASLIYPEKDLGKEFWNKVYEKAQKIYGSTIIPVNTFNKVWIVADQAKIFEHNNTAYVIGAHLKVMMEEDYLASQKHQSQLNHAHSIVSNIIRQIIIPEIEKEVNQGQNFANLRQMFYVMILASWYKEALKTALLNQVYSNKNKIGNLSIPNSLVGDPLYIYQQYLKAYKKGVFNYVKENSGRLPRKYFSGGELIWPNGFRPSIVREPAMITPNLLGSVGDLAMASVNMDRAQAVEDKFPRVFTENKVSWGEAVKLMRDVLVNEKEFIGLIGINTRREVLMSIGNKSWGHPLLNKFIRKGAGAKDDYLLLTKIFDSKKGRYVFHIHQSIGYRYKGKYTNSFYEFQDISRDEYQTPKSFEGIIRNEMILTAQLIQEALKETPIDAVQYYQAMEVEVVSTEGLENNEMKVINQATRKGILKISAVF